jgi:hypothetical protein
MKKLTLLMGALMIVGASFAGDGKDSKKACCKKSEKSACCKKDGKHCEKDAQAKKEEAKAVEKKS